jgi:hypothetical protein
MIDVTGRFDPNRCPNCGKALPNYGVGPIRDAMVSAARCFTRWALFHVFILFHMFHGRREGSLLVPRTRTFHMFDNVVFGTYNQNAKK